MSGITRRMLMALLASSVLATAAPAFAQQDVDEIIIGGSMPLTGVFAFAGVAIEAGIRDYVKMINEEGGINGKPVRFIYEDTGHQIDQAVAIFNKLTTQHRNIHLYYGDFDRLLPHHQPGAGAARRHHADQRVLCLGNQQSGDLLQPVHCRSGLFADGLDPA